MSTPTASSARRESSTVRADDSRSRVAALAGLALLTLAYLSTLHWAAGFVGARDRLLVAVGVAVVAAWLLRSLHEERVGAVAAGVAGVALLWYSTTVLPSVGLGALWDALVDGVAMTSGISVRQMAGVETWIVAVTPIPVFLSTYLALRRRYVLATVAGGWLALFLALTGDATSLETLVAALGAVMTVGFGELDRRGGSVAGADVLVVLVAVMAVLGLFVPLVPSGEAETLSPSGGFGAGDDGAGTSGGAGAAGALDEAVLADGSITAGGPVDLSTEVRFVVNAEEPRRWRTDVLDRYDGESWQSVGSERPYRDALEGPESTGSTLVQTVQLQAGSSGPLPHAAYPVSVFGVDESMITVEGTVVGLEQRMPAGTTYTVRSQLPPSDPEQLRSAGSDYPPGVENRYLQLPDDLPTRVGNLSEQITADADTDYDRAVAIEAYLEDSKDYSLDVAPPEGDMVDGFLFDMQAGYCTYFASSMATMLRTQDVPARVAVGYNSGQAVGDDTYVIRGSDAHAWVEVYVPDVGWVEFDPTPAADWGETHGSAVEAARDAGNEGVDVDASENVSIDYPGSDDDESSDTDDETGNETPGGEPGTDPENRPDVTGVNGTDRPYVDPDSALENQISGGNDSGGSDRDGTGPSSTESRLLDDLRGVLLATLFLAGVVAGARRTGVAERVWRPLGILWQRRVDPATDVQRAIDRLERLLGRQYRPRRPGETPREYLEDLPRTVDDRVRRAYELHERARYAGHVEADLADELVGVVDDLTRESVPVVRRFQ